jgi:hypothetical protein
VLNFSGLSSTDTVTFLATGNINLGGILNLTSNVNFETSGNIIFNGIIDTKGTNLSLIANTPTKVGVIGKVGIVEAPIRPIDITLGGTIDVRAGAVNLISGTLPPSFGGNIIISGNGGIADPGSLLTGGTVTLAAVPEPETFLQLLCGLVLLVFVRRKQA